MPPPHAPETEQIFIFFLNYFSNFVRINWLHHTLFHTVFKKSYHVISVSMGTPVVIPLRAQIWSCVSFHTISSMTWVTERPPHLHVHGQCLELCSSPTVQQVDNICISCKVKSKGMVNVTLSSTISLDPPKAHQVSPCIKPNWTWRKAISSTPPSAASCEGHRFDFRG